jgi:hypothetical protein
VSRQPRFWLRVGYVVWALLLMVGIAALVAAGVSRQAGNWYAVAAIWVAILAAVASWPRTRTIDTDPVLQLVTMVAEKSQKEIEAYGLEGYREMADLRWQLVGQPDTDLRAKTGLAADAGTIDELTKSIGRNIDGITVPRLVITGAMGGGKTCACVLLAAVLAEQAKNDKSGLHRRVPLSLKLSTWDPGIPVEAWIERQLLEDFPYLSSTPERRQVAADLAENRILPIMDGLDELPEEMRPGVIKAIESQWRDRPFVLSCRSPEFEHAVAGLDRRPGLHHVLVAELQPLRPAEAADILEAHDQPPDTRLNPLVSTLRSQPESAVAQALDTPFMVSLARDTDVAIADLLTASTSTEGADAIRRQLLGAFIQARYAKGMRWPADRARRYLQFFAHRTADGKLEWWQLEHAVPSWVFLLVGVINGGVVCSVLAAGFFTLFNRPWVGFWIGLGAGVLGAVIVWRVDIVPQDRVPRRARPRFWSPKHSTRVELARTLGFGLMGAAPLAVMTWFLYRPPRYTIIGAVLSGLTFAVARYLSQPNDPVRQVTPESLLAADRATVLYATFAGAFAGFLTGGYLGLVFREGHRASLGSLAILRYQSPLLLLLGAVGGAILSGAGLGLMTGGSSAWGLFLTTRLWLALRGRTPLRLMAFLSRACECGVLRRVSGYYEFRHQLLQDYLTELPPEPAADAVEADPAPAAGA